MPTNMRAYSYTPDGWSLLEDRPLAPWPDSGDEEKDYDEERTAWLARMGFNACGTRLGDPDGFFNAIIFNQQEMHATGFPALVELELWFQSAWIYLPDFPSYACFLQQVLLPFERHTESQEILEDARRAMVKLFTAYHGHPLDEHCPSCDPRRYRERGFSPRRPHKDIGD